MSPEENPATHQRSLSSRSAEGLSFSQSPSPGKSTSVAFTRQGTTATTVPSEAGELVNAQSSCAASQCSDTTLSENHLTVLLKASPPVPLGRLPGRFQVYLWRASLDQPFGLTLGLNALGAVVVAKDAPHLGLRSGDEVLGLNGRSVSRISQCHHLLDRAKELQMLLYHRESRSSLRGSSSRASLSEDAACCGVYAWEPQAMPLWLDPCFNPPEPRCKASDWPLRDVLLTSGPTPVLSDGSVFGLQLVRTSRKQAFGLPLSISLSGNSEHVGVEDLANAGGARRAVVGLPFSESFASSHAEFEDCEAPEELGLGEALAVESYAGAVVVRANLPHLGLQQGDQLLQINGVAVKDSRSCKAALKNSMSVALELRRNFLAESPACSPSGGTSPTSGHGLLMSFDTASSTQEFAAQRDVELDQGWWASLFSGLRIDAFCICAQDCRLAGADARMSDSEIISSPCLGEEVSMF